jgi:hypothetical protein
LHLLAYGLVVATVVLATGASYNLERASGFLGGWLIIFAVVLGLAAAVLFARAGRGKWSLLTVPVAVIVALVPAGLAFMGGWFLHQQLFDYDFSYALGTAALGAAWIGSLAAYWVGRLVRWRLGGEGVRLRSTAFGALAGSLAAVALFGTLWLSGFRLLGEYPYYDEYPATTEAPADYATPPADYSATAPAAEAAPEEPAAPPAETSPPPAEAAAQAAPN